MKTLFLDFDLREEVRIRLSGLSFKAVKGTEFERNLVRPELGGYSIECHYETDGNTCEIKRDILVKYLRELHGRIPFGKIKVFNSVHFNGDELYKEVIK